MEQKLADPFATAHSTALAVLNEASAGWGIRMQRRRLSLPRFAVGFGTAGAFITTLKYEMLLDELPMIYSCCMFLYCLYECFKYKNTVNYPLLFLLVAYSISVTIVYLNWKQPLFHQIMYGTLVTVIVLRSVYMVLWVYPWLRGLGYTSLTLFLMGFFFWNIDNIFCDSLRGLRKRLPAGVGALTQFHAWWHILTGLGSYLHILFSLYSREAALHKYRLQGEIWLSEEEFL
uniref:Alkaline ceramidase 3 n=1 Tax=Sphaerodactylus townsendi TaxID=933632 RepID=A0ACB8FF39_9SAUR